MEQSFLLAVAVTMTVTGTFFFAGGLAWLAYDAVKMFKRHA